LRKIAHQDHDCKYIYRKARKTQYGFGGFAERSVRICQDKRQKGACLKKKGYAGAPAFYGPPTDGWSAGNFEAICSHYPSRLTWKDKRLLIAADQKTGVGLRAALLSSNHPATSAVNLS
jgi:hypothetical protein